MSYPVTVTVPEDPGQNRLWGIPILGFLVRSILVIPQAIVLLIVSIALYVFVLVAWIPILVNGRQARWGVSLVSGYMRLTTRASLYTLLVTGAYPPFGLSGSHPIELEISDSEPQSRLWGIPILGIGVRWILLIPHFIVLTILSIGVAILALVSWVPVLVNGRQAQGVVAFVGGFYRWTSRATAYAVLATGAYPPFRLAD